jgi:hypothetical protein
MKLSIIKFRCTVSFLLFIFGVASAFAQTGTTSVRGTVTDKSGAAITGAKVTLSNAAQAVKRETTTSETGAYEVGSLQPGTYSLVIEMAGFRKFEIQRLELLVNSPSTVNATLDIGQTTETVEVSAQTQTLNTSDASLGNAFDENQVKQLPLEGRNVPDLLSLQPGVAYTGNRSDVPTFDTRNGAVNGARSDQSNVFVDGIESNDEQGHAFTSVLPVTVDSVQEFRVTTTNYNADQGGSSGAQVSLVTKSGTNNIHGSAYEYMRNTYTSANDYFVKAGQIDNCQSAGIPLSSAQCNTPPKLIRNIFGASLGGPIKKDRLFLFMNFEGTRRAEAQSVSDVVPSEALKDGVIFYQCERTDKNILTNCPGGSVIGQSGASYAIPTPTVNSNGDTIAYYALTPGQITNLDPLHIGPSAPVSQYLQTWPKSNSSSCGDGFNYQCFNFSGPISETKNEYIAKLDYNITRDARHHFSVMGAMRTENKAGAPFLPGQAPSQSLVNFNRGIVVNYSGVLSSTVVNNFRYGFVRESVGVIGNSNQDWIFFRGLNDQTGAVTRTHSFQRPTNTFADDVSWNHGKHTWQFGAQLGFVRTPSISYLSSFSDGSANASWTNTSGYAQKASSPLYPGNGGFPNVDPSFANSYDFPITALLGLVTEVDGRYNFQRNGSPLPDGSALKRRFATNSYEFYGQDTWKVKPNLTLTLGLRWSLFSPPWETNKLEVTPTTNLDQFYINRGVAGANGVPSNQDPLVSFDWGGKANGRAGYYNWDKKNFAPRLAFAWAPKKNGGLLGSLFGEGKTSIRGGFGVVFDRFGQGLVDDFNQFGSFGLSTELSNPAGFESVTTAPRLTDLHTIPTTDNAGTPILIQPPPAVFPQTFPTGTFFIGSSIDKGLKTPYSYTIDFSVAREFRGGFSLEVSYVGRLSHRLLTQLDVATPLNRKDKASGVDYFTAASALAKLYRSGVVSSTFSDSLLPANIVKYWQNMIQPATGSAYALGSGGLCSNPTAPPPPTTTTDPVLAAFDLFCSNSLNETTALLELDYFGIPDASDPNAVYYPTGGQFSFYNPQFATLYIWKSMGAANYHAMQASLRHKMSHGVQFDFNYTFSKSIDLASDAERVGTIGGTGAQIQNAWNPYQFRAVSDFDATHQFNANWVAALPFGKGRAFGRNSGKALDAIIGGWQLSGLFRLTSGFPFSVTNGFQWPTDWDLSGNVYQIGKVKTGTFHSPTDPSVVSAFSNFDAAQGSFVEPLPGQAGQRNFLRGPGYFTLDAGLSKRWTMPWTEKQSLQLRWEVFNVLNAVRFDPISINATMDFSGTTFGQYQRLSTSPRVMQFALRYEF